MVLFNTEFTYKVVLKGIDNNFNSIFQLNIDNNFKTQFNILT